MAEQQLLLRVTPQLTKRIRDMLSNQQNSYISLQFPEENEYNKHHEPGRSGTLSITVPPPPRSINDDVQTYPATLVDLPNVIETHKTFDNITFYKVSDIGQMLIVQDATTIPAKDGKQEVTRTSTTRGLPAPPPIKYHSGITPPTRDIRTKRFERNTTLPCKVIEQVENMLSNIQDNTPVHTFELVVEEEELDEYEDEENVQQELQSVLEGGEWEEKEYYPMEIEETAPDTDNKPARQQEMSQTLMHNTSLSITTFPSSASHPSIIPIFPSLTSQRHAVLQQELQAISNKITELETQITEAPNKIVVRKREHERTEVLAVKKEKEKEIEALFSFSSSFS